MLKRRLFPPSPVTIMGNVKWLQLFFFSQKWIKCASSTVPPECIKPPKLGADTSEGFCAGTLEVCFFKKQRGKYFSLSAGIGCKLAMQAYYFPYGIIILLFGKDKLQLSLSLDYLPTRQTVFRLPVAS